MPEMNQENNLNVENSVTPVVPVEPVNPVETVVQEPVVNVVPNVEIPNVEVKEEVVTEAPFVEIAPAEIVQEAAPVSPVMVSEIPEVLPVNNEVVNNEPVVTVTPESVVTPSEGIPPVEVANEVTPVVQVEPVVDEMPVIQTTPEVVEDMPVIETAPAVEETPVIETQSNVENPNNVINEVTPVDVQPVTNIVTETSSTTSEENTIINSVASTVTPTVSSETTQSVDSAPVEPVKKEGKKTILFIVLGVVAVLLGAVLAFYFFVYTKPQYLFGASLDILREKLQTTVNDNSGPMQVEMSLQTNINSTDAMLKPMFDNLNKLYLETNLYVDLGNKVEFMSLKSKYKDLDFVNADMFVEKENAFIKLNGIYDKYIKVILEEDIFKENETDKNAVVALEGLIDAVDNSLKAEYFTKVEKTVPLNNVVKKVTANTLVINGENIIPFVTDVVNNLKANEDFLNAYAKMENIEKEQFVNALDSFLGDIKESKQEVLNTINYQLTFYTEGLLNTPVGLGIVYEDQSYDLYFVEGSLSVFSTVDSSTELLLEVTQKEEKYTINAYIGEDTYSFVVGLKVVEKPSFTKPDVSNHVAVENLTQEDSMTILGGLTQSPGVTSFMTDFQDVISLLQMMMGGGDIQPDADLDMDFDDNTLYLE